jgi:hypothetical protein
MEDEDSMTDFDPGEAAGMLKQLTQQYTGLQSKSAAARTALQQSRAERLRQAEETIRAARFGAPSRAEQMFALSRAFLSPKRYRGIAGTLGNIVPVLGDAATAQRTAEERRSEALAKLQQGYADSSAELDLEKNRCARERAQGSCRSAARLRAAGQGTEASHGFQPHHRQAARHGYGHRNHPAAVWRGRGPCGIHGRPE